MIAVARAAKIDLYVDRLGPADKPEIWQQAVEQGATGIQTDKPASWFNISAPGDITNEPRER